MCEDLDTVDKLVTLVRKHAHSEGPGVKLSPDHLAAVVIGAL